LPCRGWRVDWQPFVWYEGVRRERAMMQLELFGSPSFIGLTMLILLVGELGGLLVLRPLQLIPLAEYSAHPRRRPSPALLKFL